LNEEDTDESNSVIDLKNSTIKKKKKKKISSSNSNQRTANLSNDDESEEEQMDTNENVSKTTIDNHVIEEEDDSLCNLPILLQDIIKNKIKQSKTNNKYLLKVGLYPAICKLLCDTSLDSLTYHSIQKEIRPFFSKYVNYNQKNYMRRLSNVANEIRDIHQLYMLEFYKDQQKEESKANRKKQHQRKSL